MPASMPRAHMPASSSAASIGKRQKPGKSSGEMSASTVIDKSTAITRQFFWEMGGSLASFATEGDYVESPITNDWSVMYRAHGTHPGAPRDGNPRRALLLLGAFRIVVNTFPVAIVIGSNTLRGNVYGLAKGDAAERGLLIIPANTQEKYSQPNGLFLLPNPALGSSIYRDFASRTSTEPTKECREVISADGRSVVWLVPPTSPYIKIIQNNISAIRSGAQDADFDLESRRTRVDYSTEWYSIPESIFKRAEVCFKTKVLPSMPHIDMTTTTFRLSRHGARFTDPVIPGDEYQNKALLNAYGTVSIRIELMYRLEPVSNVSQ